MDKAEVLFAKPSVVPTKNHLVGTNFNHALLFDDNLIYCGTHNFSYKDFFDLKLAHPNDPCQLKDKSFVTLDRLWSRLIDDFSFKMSWKMEELYGDERRNQLVFNCLDFKQPFYCGRKSTDQDHELCTTELRVCDGIANCPLGQDEDFELCERKDKFSEFATVRCTKKDVYNLNITIKAVKCDGKIECQSREDEDQCTLPDHLLLIVLCIIGLISTILAILIWKLTTCNLQRIDHDADDIQYLFKHFHQLHQTDHLKSLMKRMQGNDNAKSINLQFIQIEEKLHDGQWSQLVCCMKNYLNIGTFAKVLKDTEGQTCFDIKQTRSFQTCSRWRLLRLMKIVRPVMSHMFDLAKDSLLLIQICLTQNDGLGLTPYIRAISLAFLGSIIIPWALSSLRLVSKGPQILFGSKKLIAWLGLIVVFPVYPFVLITYESVLEEANKYYEVPSDMLETTKLHVSEFIQADVGLESHLQIVLSTILLLIAYSNTKTVNGLEALFEQEAIFYLSPILALAVSVAISLYSCISSHIKGITKKRDYWTTKSYLVILLYTTFTITVRVLSYVLYFTPSLGLFNTLRHLQGEMYPFRAPYRSLVNTSDDFYFGNMTPIPWYQITRWNYIAYQDAEPPKPTLYTCLTIDQYGYVFLGIVVLNIALQMVVKRLVNPGVFNKKSYLDILIHGISCCFIPHPMEEWDEEQGSVGMHKSRQDLVFKEMLASILINFAFNFLLLSPLLILGVNVFERHNLLVSSIGAFPEEFEAFEGIKVLLGVGYTALLLLTLLQIVSYYLYNGKFHPFAALIILPHDSQTPDKDFDFETLNEAIRLGCLSDIFVEITGVESNC